MQDIAIIGSGMAGLACARHLAGAGSRAVIFDKGRGIGGRMATRRLEIAGQATGFDHGAQYFTIRDPAFRAALSPFRAAFGRWADGGAEARFVGEPGMSSLPKALAHGLDLQQGVEIGAIRREGGAWRLAIGGEAILARRLVIAIPAPQAARLIGADHPLAPRLAGVEMLPCLTLMAAFPAPMPPPFFHCTPETGPIAWIACDNSKPGRTSRPVTFVAQAGPDWSAAHIEESPEEIARLMLPMLAEAIGIEPGDAIHASAHRWRYARVREPLGEAFLRDAAGSLWLAGDWCLGARVEAAWQSGRAAAQSLLELGDAG